MIVIVSPTKNMKPRTLQLEGLQAYKPMLLEKTVPVMKELKKRTPFELEELMKVKEKLAVQAFMDIQDFKFENEKIGTPAISTYDGLVFKQLEWSNLSKEELKYLQKHMRILSAVYGMVRPLDLIQPYRLEMQCSIKIQEQSLYDYWKEPLEEVVKDEPLLINLASKEYSKALAGMDCKWIDVDFYVMKDGKRKIMATYAKIARGQMIRYMATKQVTNPEQLKDFDWDGYEFVKELSSETRYVFCK